MTNPSLNLTDLDVQALATDLKTFMKSQSAYRDYDYEGSNISAIIRLLAYNTFKNSFYLNMVMNEGFLDTCQTRSSLISHAKELNYTPRSARSAKATITIAFNGTQPTYLVPKGRTFSTLIRNNTLVFSVPETLLLTSTTGAFTVTTDLYEGPYVTDSYVFDPSSTTQRLVLRNENADTRSLVVAVYEDGDVEGQTYSLATSLLDVDEFSKVYFLQQSESGQYEVVFGDDVVGKRPADGSTILLDYRIARGDIANGAKVFTPDFSIGDGVSNIKITLVSPSDGGDAPETDASIRYYAPRHFQTQERAVSAPDYEILLRQEFPEISAVSVFGGEEVEPPRFGSVFVALDIANVDGIPSSKRDEYYNFLKRRVGLTIQPIFIEPKYTYLSITSRVLYNVNVTTISPENLSALIVNDLLAFAVDHLNDFNATARYSRITGHIDEADASVVGNQTVVSVYKKVPLVKGQRASTEVNFDFPLYDGYPTSAPIFPTADARTVASQSFTYGGDTVFLTDDGDGTLWVARVTGTQTRLVSKVGTIDYGAGRLVIANLQVDDYDGPSLKIFARPADLDVTSGRNTILAVESGEIHVTVAAVRE